MDNTTQIIEIVIGYINPTMLYQISITFFFVVIITYIFNSDLVSGVSQKTIDKDEEKRKKKIEALRKANERIKNQSDLRKSLHAKGRGA